MICKVFPKIIEAKNIDYALYILVSFYEKGDENNISFRTN